MKKGTFGLIIWSLIMTAFGTELGRWADVYMYEPVAFWFRIAVGLLFVVVITIGFGYSFIERKEEKES